MNLLASSSLGSHCDATASGGTAVLRTKFGVLILASLLQTALWAAALHVDPFGMSSAADRASEDIFLRLYPVLYPGELRDHVQIVMLDKNQQPLKPGGSREWPLQYSEYVEVIQHVLALKPKGVFVDILFDTDEHRDAKPLLDFITGLPADGPPVVFAAYSDSSKKLLLPKSVPYSGTRVLRGLVELSATPHHYQLGTGAGGGAASAAAVLFNATAPPDERINLDRKSEFLVTWGNTLHPEDARDANCASIAENDASRWSGFLNSIVAGLSGLVAPISGAKSWERLQPCPYHTETGARLLFEGPADSSLADRIRGSYVLVGAAIDGSGDTVTSPVHGQLPGVFLHAMALDNLLTFHGRPLVRADLEWLVQLSLVFLCVFFGGIIFAGRDMPRSRREAVESLALRTMVWLLFGCILVACVAAFLLFFNAAPYNWGGVLAIGFAVFFASAGRDLLVLVRGSD